MNVTVRMIETATFERTYDLPEFAALAGVEPTEEAVRALLADDERRCDTYCVQGRPGVLDGTVDAAPTITDREWDVRILDAEPMSRDTFPSSDEQPTATNEGESPMPDTSALPQSLTDFYGPPISVYTRAQAIEDGTLVDVSELAQEAGFNLPTAMTREAWNDLAEWTAADEKRKGFTGQSTTGRLWDVLNVSRAAAKAALRTAVTGDGTARYGTHVYRVKREGRGTMPRRTPFHVHIGGGDRGEPVITFMLPHES